MTHPAPNLKYRADIDGLRAIAVLSVFAFHLGALPGGFVGVDIFFVISGYLITTIIAGEVQRGEFSLIRFYERRIRRIAPALFVMLAVCVGASLFVLAPDDARTAAQSGIAALLSAGNIYFALEGDYFAKPAETEPFLHTWSLGVEEQFYILFPLLLMMTRARRAPVAIVLAASFALSVWGSSSPSQFDFYLLHTRAWEMMLGSAVAVGLIPAARKGWVAEGLALSGLGAFALAFLLLDETVAWPGYAALLPCLATIGLIIAGPETKVARVLSWRPVVFIGLISYSLYLWHWPVIVFQRLNWVVFPSDWRLGGGLAVIAAAFVLAVLSWHFVEKPFRKGWPARRALYQGFFATTGVLVAGFAAVAIGRGLPDFMPGRGGPYAQYIGYQSDPFTRRGTCFQFKEGPETVDETQCLTSQADRTNILLLGDSHAAALYWGLSRQLNGAHVMQANASTCRPTVRDVENAYPRCRELMDRVFRWIDQERPQIDHVLLAGNWDRRHVDGLVETARWLEERGYRATIVGPIPQYDRALPRLLTLQDRIGDENLTSRHLIPRPKRMERILAKKSQDKDIPYISLFDILCPNGKHCLAVATGGVPMQHDMGHLTAEGSDLVASRIAKRHAYLLGARTAVDP